MKKYTIKERYEALLKLNNIQQGDFNNTDMREFRIQIKKELEAIIGERTTQFNNYCVLMACKKGIIDLQNEVENIKINSYKLENLKLDVQRIQNHLNTFEEYRAKHKIVKIPLLPFYLIKKIK